MTQGELLDDISADVFAECKSKLTIEDEADFDDNVTEEGFLDGNL